VDDVPAYLKISYDVVVRWLYCLLL